MNSASPSISPVWHRIAVWSFFFITGLVFSSWASRIVDIKTSLGLNDAQLGTVLFALPIGQLSVMALSGYLVTRFGSKNTLRFSAFLYPIFLFLISFAQNGYCLFALLMSFGMVANLNNISINTQAVNVERIYGRSIMGAFHGVWSAACFCGGILSAFLVGFNFSVAEHFALIICITFLMSAFAFRFLVPADAKPELEADAKKTRRSVFKPTYYIVMLGLISFGSMACEGTMFDWSVIYFHDVIGMGSEHSRLGFVTFMSAMAGGRFVSDKFITRFGYIRVLRFSGVIIACGLIFSALFPNPWAAGAGFLMVGAGVSSVVPTSCSLAGRSRRMSSGMALATVSTIGFFGFLLGPPLIGYVAQISSLRISFAIMACVGLIVTFVAPKLKTHVEN